MESSTSTLINRKWLLCILFSFLGFLFLSLYLNQGRWQPVTVVTSLRSLEVPNYEAPIANISTESLQSAAPLSSLPNSEEATIIELSPQYSTVDIASPQPSLEEKLASEPSDIDLSSQHSASLVVSSKLLDAVSDEKPVKLKEEKCNVFDGRWVYDSTAYPLYHVHQCPFLSEQVSCQKNGRPDSDYEHWRWEARGCEIPRFNGTYMLERLRGKRVVIVGDSLNRNQWESLSCLLYSSIRPSRAIVKTRRPIRIFRAMFFWSPFLVRLDETKDGSKVLKLEKLSESARRWQGADVMVFNTGHWWTHHGRMKSWKYFEHRGELVEEMKGYTAFKIAMKTWARWIDRRVDPTKTTVFFRINSLVHKQTNLEWCYNQIQPITNETYLQWYPRSVVSIVERTIHGMRTPVKYLSIKRLSEYRRDAHVSVYTTRHEKPLTKDQQKQPNMYANCNHWCLPGLPDTWNVLLYAAIIETLSIIL